MMIGACTALTITHYQLGDFETSGQFANAQKQPTRNIFAKKRVGQEDVDSDYLFASLSGSLPN
jgi:hypothetical protein